LHEAGLSQKGIIGITQTRRVAATSLAQRISDEQGCKLGITVGYSVRFEEVSSSQTRIKFLTDGMLVQTLLSDPLLEAYSVIIIDEAHERTLRTDLLLSRLKDIQKQRNISNPNAKQRRFHPLKVVIMSATLDAEKFSKFYGGSVTLIPIVL
jgi:ATP-dependent RNA helicase DHX33